MTMRRWMRDPVPALAVLIGVLMAGLAFLQHRWLSAVSTAERARMKANAAGRAEALARDLDRELTRAFLMLGLDPEAVRAGDLSSYSRAYASWKARALYPDLVADVWLVEAGSAEGGAKRFDPSAGRFGAAVMPAELATLVGRLGPVASAGGVGASLDSVDASVPALIVPAPRRLPVPDEDQPSAKRGHVLVFRRDWAPATWTVIRIDGEALARRILPELARRHAGGADGLEYHVTIMGPLPGRATPGVVWQSDPAAPRSEKGADALARAFSVRFDDIDAAILPQLIPEHGLPAEADAPARGAAHRVFALRIAAGPPGSAGGRAPWTVALFHRAGSVEAAVAGAQRRSAAVAGGILLLLGGSAALVVASARRERLLAGRQLEFVAAVSHELRTPLTVIRSAAENLRDGLVVDPARVREYGGLLREEGRRLTDMVEQVLAFAGADAAGPDRRKAVDVEALARAAVAEAGLDVAGLEVRLDVEPGLRVIGDEATLGAALRNLLVNLRKYAAGGGFAGVSARSAGSSVEIVVEDRGPGLDADEIGRVFEPFFRGRRASESQAAGSGIGLALVRRIVEAHGGTLEARPLPRGVAFVVRIPGAPSAEIVAATAPARGPIR